MCVCVFVSVYLCLSLCLSVGLPTHLSTYVSSDYFEELEILEEVFFDVKQCSNLLL